MKVIVTETALETEFWSAAIRTAANLLRNGFTVPQPRPKFFEVATDPSFIRTVSEGLEVRVH